MDYGGLLSRAWQLTWRHKVLWIFGMLAALISGGNGGTGFRTGAPRTGAALPPEIRQLFARPDFAALVVAGAAVVLCIALALLALAMIGRAGLIGGIQRADEQGAVTFREAWRTGTRYLWRMLGIALVLLAPALLFAVLGLMTVVSTFGFGLLLVIPLACGLALAYIPFVAVAHFATYAVVLDDMQVPDAFRKGWTVLQVNLGPVIILGVLMIVVGFVAGLLIMAPFLVVVAPAAIAYVAGGSSVEGFALVAALVGILAYLPLALLLSGILQTWTTAVWTLAWRQFTGPARSPAFTLSPPTPAAA